MASLADNFLSDPSLRQPFLGSEREDSDNKLIATVAVNPPELDISSCAAIVILCLVKSKADRSWCFRGALGQDSLAPTRVEFHILESPTLDKRKASVKGRHRGSWEGESPSTDRIISPWHSVCRARHCGKHNPTGKTLTFNEARRIANNIAKLLTLPNRDK